MTSEAFWISARKCASLARLCSSRASDSLQGQCDLEADGLDRVLHECQLAPVTHHEYGPDERVGRAQGLHQGGGSGGDLAGEQHRQSRRLHERWVESLEGTYGFELH